MVLVSLLLRKSEIGFTQSVLPRAGLVGTTISVPIVWTLDV